MVAIVRRAVGSLLPGARERRRHRDGHAAAWARHNRAVAAGEPPEHLWIALGDSTSQGVGAARPTGGWVGQLLDLLRAREPGWEVVNLSVSGARADDLVAVQLPQLDHWPPADLVTCAIGANDLFRSRAPAITGRLLAVVEHLPAGAVIATLPKGFREQTAETVNAAIREAASARGLRVADVWAHTGPPWAGKYAADWFHPNEAGYREWTAAFAASLGLGAVDGPG